MVRRLVVGSLFFALPVVMAQAGCGSSSSVPTSGSGTVSLQGAYVPAGEQASPYRSIVFADDTTYFLYLSSSGCDPANDADECRRSGTYTQTRTDVYLTDDDSGAVTDLPYAAITTAPVDIASASSSTQSFHFDDGLVDAAGGALVDATDGGLVRDGGALVCDNGPLVHATSLKLAGSTMNRVGGSSDGSSATLCDSSHASQDCADQGATVASSSGSSCSCGPRTGGATPKCPSDGGVDASGSSSSNPSGGPGMQNGDGPSDGGCSGKTITFDYQGSCDFLHRCDSYSKKLPAGQVNWGCIGHGAACNDKDYWISVPAHSGCGRSYKFCKGQNCVTARALDVSNAGAYEASQGVLDALGIPYGGGQSSCGGTYIGSNSINAKATLCN